MAFLLSKAVQLSKSHQYGNRENHFPFSQRSIHIEPGAREKALLADDPILRRFKSYKKEVRRVKRIRDVLTIIVITGCCYKTYVRATMKREAMDLAEAEEALEQAEAPNAGA